MEPVAFLTQVLVAVVAGVIVLIFDRLSVRRTGTSGSATVERGPSGPHDIDVNQSGNTVLGDLNQSNSFIDNSETHIYVVNDRIRDAQGAQKSTTKSDDDSSSDVANGLLLLLAAAVACALFVMFHEWILAANIGFLIALGWIVVMRSRQSARLLKGWPSGGVVVLINYAVLLVGSVLVWLFLFTTARGSIGLRALLDAPSHQESGSPSSSNWLAGFIDTITRQVEAIWVAGGMPGFMFLILQVLAVEMIFIVGILIARDVTAWDSYLRMAEAPTKDAKVVERAERFRRLGWLRTAAVVGLLATAVVISSALVFDLFETWRVGSDLLGGT